MKTASPRLMLAALASLALFLLAARSAELAPRINGPAVFGVRPGHPLLYSIPATGTRPLAYSVEGLPAGLTLDAQTGILRGTLPNRGDYPVVLKVRNAAGTATRRFLIKVGEEISLTPAMGWNSWNCFGDKVNHNQVIRAAKALVASGLADHGWTYINIDDGWQGKRTGPDHALGSNEKFPDMKQLSDEVHALGLKLGVYSTPWVISYAGFPGGGSDAADGAPFTGRTPEEGQRHGRYDFVENDAKQWAQWGVDYLKYDWAPLDVAHAGRAYRALRESGRDVVLSLSNSASLALAGEWPKVANSWRTTNDIGDRWQYAPGDEDTWRYGVAEIGFSQDAWAGAAGPGHWNDADMLVVGRVGWGDKLRATHLSPDEQYSHITLWCLLGSPLLLGCDLEQLDAFTLSLLTNDEVLALNQDALGKAAVRIATIGSIDVYRKPLADGTSALGFFNRAGTTEKFLFNKLGRLGFDRAQHVRDLWRQADLPDCHGELQGTVPGHGVLLLLLTPVP